MEISKEIYSRLYDIASKNLSESGGTFDYSCDVFLISTDCRPGEADILALKDLDNINYLQALYILFFYRTSDAEALKLWKEKANMSVDEFRRRAVQSLSKSQEFFDKRTELINNLYSSGEAKQAVPVYSGNTLVGSGQPAEICVNKLYRFYKKLPTPIRNLIRKIVGIK